MLAAILKVLAEPFSINERSYGQRLRLMSLHETLSQVSLPLECAGQAAELYMYASYAGSQHVSAVKRMVNKWFRDLAMVDKVVECERASEWQERPIIVVPLEAANSGHVMFRTFADPIKQLRKRFEVVGLIAGDYANWDFVGVFDRVIQLDSGNIAGSADAIHALRPEIILYPSVGMTSWCVALSNLRLAPIQVAFPGHPASTWSDVIDYYMAESDVAGAQEYYSEKLITLPVGSTRSTPKEFTIKPKDNQRFRVAIPATAMKIIPTFLHALQSIKAECPEIEYHFFTHYAGLDHAKVEYDLKQWFSDCKVYHRADYADYMNQLNQCALGLITFPFGAANSLLDCFACDIPVITLEGLEIHERMASGIMRRVGMDSLITQSVAEFVRIATSSIRLIQRGYGPQAPSPDEVALEFCGEGPIESRDAYLNAFTAIYEAACRSRSLQVA